MLFRLLALFVILLFIYGYLGLHLAASPILWILLALPFLFILNYIFILRSRIRKKNLFGAVLSQLAYLNLGFLSFLFVFTLASDFFLLISLKIPAHYILLGSLLALTAGAIWGSIGPRVKKMKLPYPELSAGLQGFRILQISDLHIGPNIGEAYVARVVAMAKKLKPDLIAYTGDIGDTHADSAQQELTLLADLASIPSYLVLGNHEYYWNAPKWVEAFQKAGINVLENAGKLIAVENSKLFIGGITDPAALQLGKNIAPDLEAASVGSEGADFKLLLSHRPGFADESQKFDLQLSGHTHGGQFFPWNFVVRLVHRYSLGAYRLGKRWIYVSAGTGSWGPRIRLGTTAEITLIELCSE